VLNRHTGQVQQYIFSFSNNFKVFDNRTQSFLRDGTASTAYMRTVDPSSISLVTTLDTGIHNEELY
jgi:hypothetical protein